MAKRVSLQQAEQRLAGLVQMIGDEESIVIEHQGTPVAVLIRPEDWTYYQELARRDLFALVDDIHGRNQDLDPDEVLRDVTAAVEEVRQARHEQRRRPSDGR